MKSLWISNIPFWEDQGMPRFREVPYKASYNLQLLRVCFLGNAQECFAFPWLLPVLLFDWLYPSFPHTTILSELFKCVNMFSQIHGNKQFSPLCYFVLETERKHNHSWIQGEALKYQKVKTATPTSHTPLPSSLLCWWPCWRAAPLLPWTLIPLSPLMIMCFFSSCSLQRECIIHW